MPARPPRRELIERVAHACAYDFSIAKQLTPKQMYEQQTDGTRMRFREQAAEWLTALRKAGLVVTVRGRGKRG